MSNKNDDGATPEPVDEASLSECKRDGGPVQGKHHWVWTDGFHNSWNQHCTRCPETRVVDPKKKVQ